MFKLFVFAAVLALASANLKELLAGGGDHAHGHGDHHGEHHGDHHAHHDAAHHGDHGDHGDHHAHHEEPAPVAVPILRQEFNSEQDGSFTAGYETADGITADMSGQNKLIGDQVGMEMRGSYQYKSPEGKLISVRWIANEEGFNAEPQISE